MGLQRPSEPFHRVYSTPEPPSPARRPMVLALLAVAAACAVAGAVVFLVMPGGERAGGEDAAAVRPVPADTSRTPLRSGPSRIVRALPPPCGAVSQATVDRTVPRAERRQDGNSTLTTCTFSEGGSGARWLRVETRLYAPDDTAAPLRDAESGYDERWAQAKDAPMVRTYSLERRRGLGDEAYRWFKADRSSEGGAGPAVIGQVTARTRNAVLTVSYGERAPGGDGARARERACLDRATAVAREVVTALNRF